ncbi:eukaryotic translation initiation factor 3 subunit A-like [Salvia splendens]|uniref:eukaryotic translation initiation factor 3 subunit A-like n=1 Tax=Salvia splendens TaxID=180675 RepID=UPI001C263C64|nr:eukaryotic translation initiation factor 3 subunit A-like [Salvia splendens]
MRRASANALREQDDKRVEARIDRLEKALLSAIEKTNPPASREKEKTPGPGEAPPQQYYGPQEGNYQAQNNMQSNNDVVHKLQDAQLEQKSAMDMLTKQLSQIATSLNEMRGNEGKIPASMNEETPPAEGKEGKNSVPEPGNSKIGSTVRGDDLREGDLGKPLPSVAEPFFLDPEPEAENEVVRKETVELSAGGSTSAGKQVKPFPYRGEAKKNKDEPEYLETELMQEQIDNSELSHYIDREVAGWCEAMHTRELTDEELAEKAPAHTTKAGNPTTAAGSDAAALIDDLIRRFRSKEEAPVHAEVQEPEEGDLKGVVDLVDDPEDEDSSVDQREARRRARRCLRDEIDDLAQPTEKEFLAPGAEGKQEEETPGSDGEEDEKEERRLAAERKCKGKHAATPQPKKSKKIASVKNDEAPLPAPAKVPYANEQVGPSPASESEDEEEESESEPPQRTTPVWLPRGPDSELIPPDDQFGSNWLDPEWIKRPTCGSEAELGNCA